MATKAQIFDVALSGLRFDGAALNAGLLYFYEPGTTTARAVYTTRNKTVEAANPFTLDSNGQGEVFLDGVYDVVAKTSAGATKATWEGYEGGSTDATALPTEVSTAGGNVAKTLPTDASWAAYVKTTADANEVTFTTSDGSTIAETVSLTVQYASVTFRKVGTVWYRVG